jgi:hypothetical protein
MTVAATEFAPVPLDHILHVKRVENCRIKILDMEDKCMWCSCEGRRKQHARINGS